MLIRLIGCGLVFIRSRCGRRSARRTEGILSCSGIRVGASCRSPSDLERMNTRSQPTSRMRSTRPDRRPLRRNVALDGRDHGSATTGSPVTEFSMSEHVRSKGVERVVQQHGLEKGLVHAAGKLGGRPDLFIVTRRAERRSRPPALARKIRVRRTGSSGPGRVGTRRAAHIAKLLGQADPPEVLHRAGRDHVRPRGRCGAVAAFKPHHTWHAAPAQVGGEAATRPVRRRLRRDGRIEPHGQIRIGRVASAVWSVIVR